MSARTLVTQFLFPALLAIPLPVLSIAGNSTFGTASSPKTNKAIGPSQGPSHSQKKGGNRSNQSPPPNSSRRIYLLSGRNATVRINNILQR